MMTTMQSAASSDRIVDEFRADALRASLSSARKPKWIRPSIREPFRVARAALLEQLEAVRASMRQRRRASGQALERPAPPRTTYVVGLFGTGRTYLSEALRRNIGRRSIYLKDGIRCQPGPTSMIYTGHCTMKYPSRNQSSPAVTSEILESVRARDADLIFLYRHPLDSLLTNWVWWRTYLRYHTIVNGISQVYSNKDDLCADLLQNFLEFKAFCAGDPAFFASSSGTRFLSFTEFVEESELFLDAATLTLRLEDFMGDPVKEFLKIGAVMSVELDASRLRIAPPKSQPYGYRTVMQKVPPFRQFIEDLDGPTRARIQRLGYGISA
jgi:hypothetical protein